MRREKISNTRAYKIGYSIGYNTGFNAAKKKNPKVHALPHDFNGWYKGTHYICGLPMPKPII